MKKKITNIFDFKHKKLTLECFDKLERQEKTKLNNLKSEQKQKAKKLF